MRDEQGRSGNGFGGGESNGGKGPDWFAFTACRLVAKEFGVAERALWAETGREQPIAFIRQVAMYMAHTTYQLNYREVAAAFGRERTTVAHACAVVEDARDDAELEDRLDKIEARLRGLARIVHGRPTAAPAFADSAMRLTG